MVPFILFPFSDLNTREQYFVLLTKGNILLWVYDWTLHYGLFLEQSYI
jgi:hypothetical protein